MSKMMLTQKKVQQQKSFKRKIAKGRDIAIIAVALFIVLMLGLLVFIVVKKPGYSPQNENNEQASDSNGEMKDEIIFYERPNVHDPEVIQNMIVEKPVIYVYPKEDDTRLDIKLESADGDIDTEYPASVGGTWSITADRDGTIYYRDREYNYLFWEDNRSEDYNMDEGFCVKGEDTVAFLENALEELGLTQKEQADFITYWLPRMKNNEYNMISFNPPEYEGDYKLSVSEECNIINAFMCFRPSDSYVKMSPQNLNSLNDISRERLTIVTWGGTEQKKRNEKMVSGLCICNNTYFGFFSTFIKRRNRWRVAQKRG